MFDWFILNDEHTATFTDYEEIKTIKKRKAGYKMSLKIRFFIFQIKWLWKNRKWRYCRQKKKAFWKDWDKYLRGCN